MFCWVLLRLAARVPGHSYPASRAGVLVNSLRSWKQGFRAWTRSVSLHCQMVCKYFFSSRPKCYKTKPITAVSLHTLVSYSLPHIVGSSIPVYQVTTSAGDLLIVGLG
ncbi:hypothetical protein F4824DRAFT_103547 [Ustulina deusta]|nr:hypothetical protein F4823DRAFT_86650 [Ustulina deusta]KAI3337782.1 hypothetical protein F4824DRAFT_103547 [Ustulina deusta]